MSVFVPSGADVAVDPLDVLLVAPNGSTSTTLYLAQGQPVVVAALPAAVVAELDAAADLVGPDTLFTTPVTASEWPSPIYIAGAQVKRVQSSGATQLGSMVLFALSGFMVTVPDVDLSDMVDLINATTTGGGGGEGAFFASPTNYEPTITETPGLTTAAQMSFVRAGEGPTAQPGDWILLYGYMEIESALVGNGAISFPLPVSGEVGAGYCVTFYDSENTPFQIGTDFVEVTINATFAAQTYYTNFSVSYQVEGV